MSTMPWLLPARRAAVMRPVVRLFDRRTSMPAWIRSIGSRNAAMTNESGWILGPGPHVPD